MRGSVAPPTQRLTVLTDTPSWRAAASWVRPSRRSALDIQAANVSGSPAAPAADPAGSVADGPAPYAPAPAAA